MSEKKLWVQGVFTYDPDLIHGDDPEAIAWFRKIMLTEKLSLLSHELGDTVGDFEVIAMDEEVSIFPGFAGRNNAAE